MYQKLCILLFKLLECLGKLIRAGGALKAALDAGELFDGILDAHTGGKRGDAFGISGTAAFKIDV